MANAKRKKQYSLTKRQNRAGWLFVLPFAIGFLMFFLKPMIESFWYTFNDVTMGNSGLQTKFVGLGNFRYLLLEDSNFLRNLWTVVSSMLAQVAICTILSLFIAIVLVKDFRGRTLYRAIFFLPIIMTSGVVYSMVSSVVGSSGLSGTGNAYIYSSVSMTTLMQQGGIPNSVIGILTRIIDAIFSMVVNCGVPILLYISGLQKIPKSSYEAAKIEGASTWDIFWRITIPKISPIIFLNVVYCVIDASTAYGSTAGGNVMMAAIQQMGFGKTMKFGMSAAMAWMYFLVIALFLAIAWLLLGRRAAKIEN